MSLQVSKTYKEDLRRAISASIGIEKLNYKKILITGATGMIGSFLVDMLMQYNLNGGTINVFAAGRNIERLETCFDSIKTDYLHYVKYDLMKPIMFDFQVDYVIHTASNAHPMAFNSDPVGTIVGNVVGTYNLLKYADEYKVHRFCYISSGEVYGQGNVNLESFEESYSGYLDINASRSSYPNSKRIAETLCSSYANQYGLETVIVRPCHTYGPGMTPDDSRANAQFIRNVLNDEDIVMKSEGSQMRSYCYIADCASGIITVLLNGNKGQAYNIANPDARTTIMGLAKIIAECSGKKVVYVKPDKVDLVNRTFIEKQVLNSKKLESLGWKGEYSILEGISHTLTILKEI
ncbi:MAG: NAD-dependent epimerase/dehydratase family protein [Lachnospiraceae bacterium]|nr:NAD-dependent epimerase/dehydratase family protein [Lachnospiraceae bacterium]